MKTLRSTRKPKTTTRRPFAAECQANRLVLRRSVEAHRRRCAITERR